MVDTSWDSEFVGLCFALGRAYGKNIRVFFLKWEEGQSRLVLGLCPSQGTCHLGELGKVIFFSQSLRFQIWGVGLIIDHEGYLSPQ